MELHQHSGGAKTESMSPIPTCRVSFEASVGSKRSGLSLVTMLAVSFSLAACSTTEQEITPIVYECGSDPNLAFERHRDDHTCGRDENGNPDPKLMRADGTSIEPSFPADGDVCQTLYANKSFPDEHDLDARVQDALTACRNVGPVRLKVDPTNGANDAFVTGHLNIYDVVLWVDEGVTLYASRDPYNYQNTGNCGALGINDASACSDYITVGSFANQRTPPGIIGKGVIDGQGGEPLVGHDYSWWQMSGALRDVDGSIGNPTLINVGSSTTRFWMYQITLHNSPKFHVKVSSAPVRPAADAVCTTHGDGFIIWGITILTPSNWFNSQGLLMTPQFSRNSDGIDPGSNDDSYCGVIACNTISTGDDQIAIKGGHSVSELIIAHNHFGTGHGMSIGSETYGDAIVNDAKIPAVSDVEVYDLTIDADSRWVGNRPSGADFNGIRIKTDTSRGGNVTNISYHDICMRDMTNSILVSTAYNPLFAGSYLPDFGNLDFQNIHGVTCMAETQTIVSINGFNVNQPTGPVRLDNVIMDNIGPQSVSATFANILLGPGNVNFTPSGLGVTVTDEIEPGSKPFSCAGRFPTLPVPKGKPKGWVW
jgi:polygalacturonase